MLLELTSSALNPNMLLFGNRSVRALVSGDDNQAALMAFEAAAATCDYTLYDVRRVFRQRFGDPTRPGIAWRSIRHLASGTEAATVDELRWHADAAGVPVSSRIHVHRAVLRSRGLTLPTKEHLQKPMVGEARAIADVSLGRYRSLLEDRGLPSRQARSRAVHEVLGAWAPRGLSPAAWWLEEQIREEVGSRAQQAEIAATLVAYNREDGWLDRVPEYQAKAAHAAIQHDALQPTRRCEPRLLLQSSYSSSVHQTRPPSSATPTRSSGGFGGCRRYSNGGPSLGGTGERIDYERGLEQVAVRLRVANRQVVELEAARRLGRDWDDAQGFELARAEASALTLRARELALTARLETFRPPWLDAAVGPAPADPTLRARWRRGVLEVLRWRVDHDVVDQTRPLGLRPTHPAELRRYEQAVQHLSGIARSIGHTLVLAPEPGRDGPPDRLPRLADRSQPALPGRPEIALGWDAGREIGIDLP